MIKLNKGNIPEILKNNAVKWTQEFNAKLAAGAKPTVAEGARYRHPEIKQALIDETHGKCAYCESKLRHIHHGDVEHIAPKSLHPSKRFMWDNLTLACEICNQNKSDNDPNVEHIIDPYITEPGQHLTFIGAFVFPLGTDFGKNSQAILDLNRIALIEVRKSRMEKIMLLINNILDSRLPVATRSILLKQLIANECQPASEYSAMCNSILDAMKDKFPAEIIEQTPIFIKKEDEIIPTASIS